MLNLTDIRKSYTTGDFTQKALDGVSISFRDSEFVAILGPSGSGKTTLLNIIGGLDHYDSGDLVIDNVSTKKYKDRDWDTYRNNRIGFVFQSYNLIPHQTVLANVELALTLSGVGKDERKKRAQEALERVGLGEHMHKHPYQLSGGQMQRVAIARALINNPDILLADEPTGALDSKTSVQIMDLLTEIAQDRLVIMVTHNPDLADEYANRIVSLADGVITDDTNPYMPTEEEMHDSVKKIHQTSMSFKTALSLSFTNLMTKKARTIMTSIAGSIGIIGIAAILALANGVNLYIEQTEEETLSQYPLQIATAGFNMTSMIEQMTGSASDEDKEKAKSDKADENVSVTNVLTSWFSSVGTNDLASLKTFLESDESDIDQYTNAIEYIYPVTPLVFSADTSEKIHQVNPDKSFSGLTAGSSSMTSSFSSNGIFYSLPKESSLYDTQYEVLAGHWPEAYNECVMVVSSFNTISDYMLYTLGLRDPDELQGMISSFLKGEEVVVPESDTAITYNDILNVKFKVLSPSSTFQYDSTYGIWKDKSSDTSYMKNLIDEADDLKIVGIVKLMDGKKSGMLYLGVNYSPDLVDHIINESSQSGVTKAQLASPTVDILTGRTFAEEAEDTNSGFDMSSIFTIDTDALANAFSFDPSKIDMSGSSSITEQQIMQIIMNYAADSDAIQELIANTTQNRDALSQVEGVIVQGVQAYLAYVGSGGQDTPAVFFSEGNQGYVVVQGALGAALGASAEAIATYTAGVASKVAFEIVTVMSASVSETMEKMMGSIGGAFTVNTDAFSNAFTFNLGEEDLTEVITQMMSTEERSYDSNLKSFGYADYNKPSQIDIYPKDFECKEAVTTILDDYNSRMEAQGEDSKVISYTDIVGALMSSVTRIVNMISAVLIAFVAISLVVSSIMIGVITLISVLERKKEIGVLRALGARKKDISRVFNAETIIEGFASGLFGVLFTMLICLPANLIINAKFDVENLAQLPLTAAIVLILISIALTFIAGVIPSRKASKQDPVEALRSE